MAATFTTDNGVPVTLPDDTELGIDPPLRLFKFINHWRQTILHIQLSALLPGTGGTKATAAICTAAQIISNNNQRYIEVDKNKDHQVEIFDAAQSNSEVE